MKNICIIGAGAAGLMAAVSASENAHVTIIEKNEKAGKKIYITGKGRCNVTNNADRDAFFENIVTNPCFLYSAFSSFDNNSLYDFLEQNDCPLKIERGGRVFPVSDHASDVTAAFLRYLRKNNVDIMYNNTVSKIIVDNNQVNGIELSNGKKMTFDSVIIATGGMSYPTTGSTGDGYKFAKDNNINVTALKPSLTGLNCLDEICKTLMGLTLKNVGVDLKINDKCVYSDFGELLFTHFGVSGPTILSTSSYFNKNKGDKAELIIDLKPALSPEELDKRIIKDFEINNKKNFINSLDDLLPKKLIPVIIERTGINPYKKTCEISKNERSKLVDQLKSFTLTPTSLRGFEEAIITKGGVDVKEINPKTMESKKIKDLYFAGEVLDVDALTGGFNLQIAFSTGYLAGRSCSNEYN